ncbi:MAG: hypothetical protein R2864_12095 [Syntrophotaleaceae bacterium]
MTFCSICGTLFRILPEKPRAGELDGWDYHFVAAAEFDAMVADGAFVEWALVHGNRMERLWLPLEQTGATKVATAVASISIARAAQLKERRPGRDSFDLSYAHFLSGVERLAQRAADDTAKSSNNDFAMLAARWLTDVLAYRPAILNDD